MYILEKGNFGVCDYGYKITNLNDHMRSIREQNNHETKETIE